MRVDRHHDPVGDLEEELHCRIVNSISLSKINRVGLQPLDPGLQCLEKTNTDVVQPGGHFRAPGPSHNDTG